MSKKTLDLAGLTLALEIIVTHVDLEHPISIKIEESPETESQRKLTMSSNLNLQFVPGVLDWILPAIIETRERALQQFGTTPGHLKNDEHGLQS